MISKLPRWVEYGAFLLAALAGSVNAIGLLDFQHQAISHLSGTVTLLGSNLIQDTSSLPDYKQSLHLILIITSFMAGAALSGFYIESTALKLGRRYSFALCIEGSLLLLALFALAQGSITGQYFASAACGLQNAMLTTFSNAIIRTTHVTGVITDLGIMIGEWLKGKMFDKRKAKLLIAIVTGFLFGGATGTCLFIKYQIYAFLFPATCSFVLALLYSLYLYRNHRSA
ncbi:hypothetical protein BCU68_04180 [Vibrio sp. 10N.286.49.B3]|uniref:YoaK family protein n=1 Tax=Vibrio sp. 10N.286.49.B3 TaxID=1880855 RepID=UPI000C8379E2|nr:YoaK family protein [Vibrio sp. 10N.286.49.B3]PMH43194.1 hypothetical protein BCU68_04180 [Vibrio sp. 10N.286.49.B3]